MKEEGTRGGGRRAGRQAVCTSEGREKERRKEKEEGKKRKNRKERRKRSGKSKNEKESQQGQKGVDRLGSHMSNVGLAKGL